MEDIIHQYAAQGTELAGLIKTVTRRTVTEIPMRKPHF